MNELLRQLTEATGVSGAEKEVRLLIRDLIADHVDEWSVDTMGNLLATKRGTGASDLRVLVDAHMDEVGLLVVEIESSGMLKFVTVGGFDDRALLGKVADWVAESDWRHRRAGHPSAEVERVQQGRQG